MLRRILGLLLPLRALAGCQDFAGWLDTFGWGCREHVDMNICSNGQPALGLEEYAVNGVSANDACCICGGGNFVDTEAKDTGGDGCEYYDQYPTHCGCCDTPLFTSRLDCSACFGTSIFPAASLLTWPPKVRMLTLDLRSNFMSFDQIVDILVERFPALQALVVSFCREEAATLPAAIGKLLSLEELRIFNCYLAGTIPKEVGALTNLRRLSFNGNALSGALPRELAQLSKLEELILGSNQLSGSLPPELGALPSLMRLEASDNRLSGSLPETLGDLASLAILSLGNNLLSGSIPASFGRLQNLSRLSLHSNQLGGAIPTALGQLSSLQNLDLSSNRLEGGLPPELGALPRLRELDVSENRLTGSLPPELGGLAALETLALRSNAFSGILPRELGQLSSLIVLDAADNQLVGRIPNELGKLTELVSLKLGRNRLSGTLAPTLGQLQLLRLVDISRNALSGAIPPQLGQAQNLQKLDLSFNKLAGALPPELGDLPRLSILTLTSNRLSGSLPVNLTALKRLQYLYLGQNEITGSIPVEIGGLTSLRELDLTSNQLGGLIPASLTLCSSLESLRLGSNQLSGSIPEELGFVKSLVTLDLSNNSLTGRIPESLGRVDGLRPPSMRTLDLSFNRLSGSIPPELWEVETMMKLDLSHNDLSGNILPMLGSLVNLVMLDLRSNHLSGALPEELNFLQQLVDMNVAENEITEILSLPPPGMARVDLSQNRLSALPAAWLNLDGRGSLVDIDLRENPITMDVAVLEDGAPQGCDGGRGLVAHPSRWHAVGDGAVECTELCKDAAVNIRSDVSLNITSLCRCRIGSGSGDDCTACPASHFTSKVLTPRGWRSHCQSCPEYTTWVPPALGDEDGVRQCICSAGRFMNLTRGDNASCEVCPQFPFRTTNLAGGTSPELCACNSDPAAGGYEGLLERPLPAGRRCGCPDGAFMNHAARRCTPCSAYEECRWGQEQFLNSLLPPPIIRGYWAESVVLEGEALTSFSGHRLWRCTSGSTCRGGHECSWNRFGRACSLCAPGYFGGQDGPCYKCPASPEQTRRNLGIWLCILVIVPIIANSVLQGDQDKRGLLSTLRTLRTSLRQMLKFCQVMAITSGFNVRWPLAARPFFDAMRAVSLNIGSWAGAACLFGWSSMTIEMASRWLWPVAAVVLTVAAALLVNLLGCLGARCRWLSRCADLSMTFWDVVRVLAFALSLFFPALLSSALVAFTCMPPPTGYWKPTLWTVKDFPHVQCGSSEENWPVLAGISAVMALFLLVILPITLFLAWTRECMARLQSNFTEGGWWGFFFEDYRLVHMDWTLCVLAKDIVINLIACVGAGYGAVQLMLTSVVLLYYAYRTLRRLPFMDMSNNVLEAYNGVAVAVLCSYTAGMGFQSEPGVGDVTELFLGGSNDPKYLQRAWTVVAIQFATLGGPCAIITYQIMMSFRRTRALIPKVLRPVSVDERAVWIANFCAAVGLSQEGHGLLKILRAMDEVDFRSFKQVMTRSVATLGVLHSEGTVRSRLSNLARNISWTRGSMLGGMTGAMSAKFDEAAACGGEAGPYPAFGDDVREEAEDVEDTEEATRRRAQDAVAAMLEDAGWAPAAIWQVRMGLAEALARSGGTAEGGGRGEEEAAAGPSPGAASSGSRVTPTDGAEDEEEAAALLGEALRRRGRSPRAAEEAVACLRAGFAQRGLRSPGGAEASASPPAPSVLGKPAAAEPPEGEDASASRPGVVGL